MNIAAILAGSYVAQLALKAALAVRKRASEPIPPAAVLSRITILQPVVSGDETLARNLRDNVTALHGASFIWIIDRADATARDLCMALQRELLAVAIQIVEVDEPPARINPKLWKQEAVLPHVQTELLLVLDDDTRLPRRSLDALIAALDAKADLATGLPCYVPARGAWSALIAEFVNSAAILTYLPAAQCAAPRSINGMCYALRTDSVRRTNLFGVTARSITDDLAIATELRRQGAKIVQTTQPQFISTTVGSLQHYRRLMHRWFVCARILVQNESPFVRVAIAIVFGLPPLLLGTLAVFAFFQWAALGWLAAVLIVRSVTIMILNRVLTGAPRHSMTFSLLTELLQPVFLLTASFYPVIWWRRRKIRVRTFSTFEYLQL
jgi:ceramide glucosyltransferase